jgi:hypothetical protein
MVVLTGFAALSIDAGMGYDQQRNDQDIADAAALAAAYQIGHGATLITAADAAWDIETQDCVNPSAPCTLTLTITTSAGNSPLTVNGCPSTSAQCPTGTVTQVQAQVVDTDTATNFSNAAFGSGHLQVVAKSVAIPSGGGGGGGGGGTTPVCGLCVLSGSQSHSIDIEGSSAITVSSGSAITNSTASQAVYVSGTSKLVASAVSIAGSGGYYKASSSTITPTPVSGNAAIQNPLWNLKAPTISGTATDLDSKCTNDYSACTIGPGLWKGFGSNSNIANGSMTLTMTAGTYVIEGGLDGGLILGGNNSIIATGGVTIYLTCSNYSSSNTAPCTGSDGGDLTVGGSGSFSLTAPSSGTYQGIALMVDPNDKNIVTISGTGSLALSGTIDAPDSELTIQGSGASSGVNSVLVVSWISLSGNTQVKLAATPGANAPSLYPGGVPRLVG